jgi:hypothetical protein
MRQYLKHFVFIFVLAIGVVALPSLESVAYALARSTKDIKN